VPLDGFEIEVREEPAEVDHPGLVLEETLLQTLPEGLRRPEVSEGEDGPRMARLVEQPPGLVHRRDHLIDAARRRRIGTSGVGNGL
jgi:hypothetical protein